MPSAKKLADSLNLDPAHVLVSAGLVESLDIVIRNFVEEGENMIIGEVAFVAYRLLSEVYNVAKAAKNLFYKNGNHKDGRAARLRFVLKNLGEEEFKNKYSAELEEVKG